MNNFLEEINIFSVGAKLSQAFTAAITNIITSNGHGLSEMDCVQFSSTTTLPAGLSASTNYYVFAVTTNTFKVSAAIGGVAVDITDTGTGTHTYVLKGKAIMVSDYENMELMLATSGSANFTIKVQASQQSNVNFNAAASATNRWNYMSVVDVDSGIPYAGSTGIVFSGTDAVRSLEINNNGSVWITLIVSSWVAGTLNATLTCYK